jgi:hypothetical protein
MFESLIVMRLYGPGTPTQASGCGLAPRIMADLRTAVQRATAI